MDKRGSGMDGGGKSQLHPGTPPLSQRVPHMQGTRGAVGPVPVSDLWAENGTAFQENIDVDRRI
jgi:hypothetical protein